MSKLNLETLVLLKNSHKKRKDGLCIMEAVAYFAGEPHSDHPKCTCPVLTSFAILLNDRWDNRRRQKLKKYIPKLVGTSLGIDVERKRAYVAADWACRALIPMLLELCGSDGVEWSIKLQALPEVIDKPTADMARAMVNTVRVFANATAANATAADADAADATAANQATLAAAAAAASATAAYVTHDAYIYAATHAGYVATDAAEAAGYVATDAAEAAAYVEAAANAPNSIVDKIDESALACIDRMLNVGTTLEKTNG